MCTRTYSATEKALENRGTTRKSQEGRAMSTVLGKTMRQLQEWVQGSMGVPVPPPDITHTQAHAGMSHKGMCVGASCLKHSAGRPGPGADFPRQPHQENHCHNGKGMKIKAKHPQLCADNSLQSAHHQWCPPTTAPRAFLTKAGNLSALCCLTWKF